MWPYAAAIVGVVVVVFVFGRAFWMRGRNNPGAMDAGRLSDAWLAEQRRGRNE